MTNADPVLAALADLKSHVSSVIARLDGKFERLDAKFDLLDAKVEGMQTDLADLRERFDKQPDLRLIGHQMQALIENVSALKERNVRALAAINDFARENVTPGEVEALHSELKEIRELEFRHDVRLRRIEEELHLT